jgi:predicted kinase
MSIKPTYVGSELRIPEGTLVILSGLPGSGKSQLKIRSQFVERASWVSSDELRDRISPPVTVLVNGQARLSRHEASNTSVFAIMRNLVQAGLKMGRTVVVDATNVNDAARQEWVELATEQGAPHIVVILPTSLDECLARAIARPFHVPEKNIREMHQPLLPVIPASATMRVRQKGADQSITAPTGFELTSRFNHHVLGESDQLVFTWRELPEGKWDVIGDTHGLFDEFVLLIQKAGWPVEQGRLQPHPLGRKLLLLADLVDRGLKSIELVRFMKRAVEDGLALVLKGNHEAKLIRFVETALREGIESWTSYANAETGMAFLKLDPVERDSLIGFLKALPPYLVDMRSKTVFVHANVASFQLGASTVEDMLYGVSGWKPVDTDAMYQEGVNAGINTLTLVRGHIPQTSEQGHAFSLERHPFQKGELVLMRFDEVAPVFEHSMDAAARIQAFKDALITHQCEFDYAEYSRRYNLLKGLHKLMAGKHVTRSQDASGMFSVFKYSKQTFWNNSWGESPLLLKARGLVMDPAGTIVSHPFDKVFNFGENGTGQQLSPDTPVVAIEKLNGFLGVISGHPLKKGDLLVHTQGSFGQRRNVEPTSSAKGGVFKDFVQFIKDHLTPTLSGQIKKYLASHDVTLMFEVIHEDDPHIIGYSKDMQGLHLLGVRGKNETDQPWIESKVDEAAAEMGLRRPTWSRMTFGEVKARIRTAKDEGFMVRADTPEQEFILKYKSPYYLTTKFLGRLSASRIKHLFSNPKDFKKTVDEEFYGLVDSVVSTQSVEDFLALPDETRVAVIRDLINAVQ